MGEEMVLDPQMGGGTVIAVLFSVAIWVLMSLSLFKIARKINREPAWLSWIPVVQSAFMLMMGDVKIWLAVSLTVLTFLPYIGTVASLIMLVFTIIAWVKILAKLNRPGWKVLLVIFLGVIYLPILAFSKD